MTLRKIDAKTTHDWMEQGKAVLIRRARTR